MPIDGIEWESKKAKLNLEKHGVSFENITSTVKVGQKPSKEEMKRIRKELREASKRPVVYDPDCPPSTSEALKEFAVQRAEMNRQKRRQAVTLRIQPDVLEKYKALGRGYSGIMADVLKLAADNPEILSKVHT